MIVENDVQGQTGRPKATGAYVVDGACVRCNKGSRTTFLRGTANTRFGNRIGIFETNTGSDSFVSNFGLCDTLTARNFGVPTRCAMRNIDRWIRTNARIRCETGDSILTLNSFTVCWAGLGIITPFTDGQTIVPFEVTYEEMRKALRGFFESRARCGDPIDASTGNFVYSKTDIEIPGCFPLEFKRFYNAADGSDGVMGTGWTHNYNIFLKKDGKNVKITFDDWRVEEYYGRTGGGFGSSAECKQNTLTFFEDEGYCLSVASLTNYFFDTQGRLLSISDLNENITSFSYNKYGFLSSVSNVCGSLEFEYDREDRITKINDHAGRVCFYEYKDSYLISATHPNGAAYRYDYDESGKISCIYSPHGVAAIKNEYDNKNRAVRQEFPDGGVLTVEYNEQLRETYTMEQNGTRIGYAHDEKFRTTAIASKDWSEGFEYNQSGKRTKHVDRKGNIRTYSYDKRNNLISETDPMGGSTSIEYNELSLPTKIVGALGGVTQFEYDPKGSLLKHIDPLDRTMKFANNERGFVTGVVLPDDSENALEYDERGNITAITEAGGGKTQYEYDELNRVIKTIESL